MRGVTERDEGFQARENQDVFVTPMFLELFFSGITPEQE